MHCSFGRKTFRFLRQELLQKETTRRRLADLERLRKEKQKKGDGIKEVPPPSQEERVRQTIIQLHQEMKNTFRFKERDQAREFSVKVILQ
jgi:hypothetical protein